VTGRAPSLQKSHTSNPYRFFFEHIWVSGDPALAQPNLEGSPKYRPIKQKPKEAEEEAVRE